MSVSLLWDNLKQWRCNQLSTQSLFIQSLQSFYNPNVRENFLEIALFEKLDECSVAVVFAAVGHERADRSTARQTALRPGRRQTGNWAQRKTTGTGRRNRGRLDATRPDSVDTWPDASATPGTDDTGERIAVRSSRDQLTRVFAVQERMEIGGLTSLTILSRRNRYDQLNDSSECPHSYQAIFTSFLGWHN